MSMRLKVIAAAVGICALLLFLASVSSVPVWGQYIPNGAGKELFERRCGGCHALDGNREGPSLRDVFGRPAGAAPSFHYSDALKNSRITWDERSLEKWLLDPQQLVPGTEMDFRVPKADERHEIIAYLKTKSRNSK
jgi:cytochrome c